VDVVSGSQWGDEGKGKLGKEGGREGGKEGEKGDEDARRGR